MSEQLVVSFEPFERDNKFFIKSFLLDATLNGNQWEVTPEALEAYIKTFEGKPFVVTPNFDHPSADIQEKYRKGNIIEAGIDEKTKKAYAVIEITDKDTELMIKSGELRYVSPQLDPINASNVEFKYGANGQLEKRTVKAFKGDHLAGVKKPAYGVLKAQIKGQCSGSSHTCKHELMKVQACQGCGTFEFVSIDSSLVPDTSHTPQMGDPITQTVDYSAQIAAVEDRFKAALSEKDAKINDLTAKLETAEKRPTIERILSAKLELGKIKAEETNTEAQRLTKIDAGELTLIASELEAAVKERKEAKTLVASQTKYRFKASEDGKGKVTESNVFEAIGGNV